MKTNENNTTTAIAAQSTKSTVLLSIDRFIHTLYGVMPNFSTTVA